MIPNGLAPNGPDPLTGDPPPQSLLDGRMAWTAMLSWVFGAFVLILVVVPTGAIPKLVGAFRQPISAGGYGLVISFFAIVAVLVAAGAGAWIWLAMGRTYDSDEGS